MTSNDMTIDRAAGPPWLGASNLGVLLSELAEARPDVLAVGTLDGTLTFRELHDLAGRVCGSLQAQGVRRGDRIALLAPNSAEYIAGLFGSVMAGAVAVGISTWYSAEQIRYVLGHCEPAAVFTVPEFLGRRFGDEVRAATRDLGLRAAVYDLEGTEPAAMSWAAVAGSGLGEPDYAPGGSAAYLLYTSGSTGAPKGVLLRHDGLIRNSWEAAARLGLTCDDISYVGVPLCFAYGCVQGLLTAFVRGAGVVVQRRFEPAEALRLIERYRCTAWFGVPAMGRRLVDVHGFAPERIASLSKGRVGHAPDDLIFGVQRLGLSNVSIGYGMTELYGPCAMSDIADDLESRIEGWCTVLPSTELRIMDPDTGKVCDLGVAGEIRARSRYGYLGYYRDAQRNAEAFDAEGFFRTGDQGVRRSDGRIRFTGRYKNMIKSNGLNIAAEDIEVGLLRHPAVIEACAFAMPHPVKEETAVAVVVVPGTDAEVARSLLGHRAAGFTSHEAPALVVTREPLPKMSEQKINRIAVASACREWLGAQSELTELTEFFAGRAVLEWEGVADDA